MGRSMMEVPRLALATAASGPEPSVLTLAMLAAFTAKGCRVQHFRTRACPTAVELVGQISGLPGRHLDSWLMPDSLCQSSFLRGARGAQLSVVEGTLETSVRPEAYQQCDVPGQLGQVARVLDLPVIAVLSASGCEDGVFHLPRLPEGTRGILIDNLEDPEDLCRIKRLIRITHNVPVLGALESTPRLRQEVEKARRNDAVCEDLAHDLARKFLRHSNLEAIADLAKSRPFPDLCDGPWGCEPSDRCPGMRVAYARDEAFGRYFPDTLEALEALGAELVEFSPLRDEALPEGVDLVMIGCGLPDQYAEQLSSNANMLATLRQHVCRGNRIYSEGGGTAYLGRWMIINGIPVPGAGILPFNAELLPQLEPPIPISRTLLHDCWLGPKGSEVRGYRSCRWRLTPSAERLGCPGCFGTLTGDGDMYYHHHAVGSMIHLYLGALPQVVSAFAGPHRPSLRRPSLHDLADHS
jgi:cobyrinic acid a,c-diamide synthase